MLLGLSLILSRTAVPGSYLSYSPLQSWLNGVFGQISISDVKSDFKSKIMYMFSLKGNANGILESKGTWQEMDREMYPPAIVHHF